MGVVPRRASGRRMAGDHADRNGSNVAPTDARRAHPVTHQLPEVRNPGVAEHPCLALAKGENGEPSSCAGTGPSSAGRTLPIAVGRAMSGMPPTEAAPCVGVCLRQSVLRDHTDGLAEALDAADSPYDVVVSSLTIHHLPETLRPQAIGEMFRVLRPRGSVLIADSRPPATRIGRLLLRSCSKPAARSDAQAQPGDGQQPRRPDRADAAISAPGCTSFRHESRPAGDARALPPTP
jgi:SAM-dependent methyltransferase